MNAYIRPKQFKDLREKFPTGTRVELVRMDDPQAPPIGTLGTVGAVDDMGTIHVRWDNGSRLGVVLGEDHVKKVDTVTTICYGQKRVWDSREEAAGFFMEGMIATEGSECERYTTIYSKLKAGMEVCSDD